MTDQTPQTVVKQIALTVNAAGLLALSPATLPDATVGANRRILGEHAGHEPGDPAKAAQAILHIADAAHPPLRLMLGSDALGYTKRKFQQQAEEIDAWTALTQSTDFSGG